MIGNMEDSLKSISTLNLEGKIGAAFGSYGWSGEAIEVVQDYLKKTNLKVLNTSDIIKSTGMTDIEFPLRIRFSVGDDEIKNIERAVVYTTDLLLSKYKVHSRINKTRYITICDVPSFFMINIFAQLVSYSYRIFPLHVPQLLQKD